MDMKAVPAGGGVLEGAGGSLQRIGESRRRGKGLKCRARCHPDSKWDQV